MEKLVILDACENMVDIITVGHTALGRLEEIYHNDVETWFYEEGYEEKLGVNLNNCSWKWMGENCEIKEHTI